MRSSTSPSAKPSATFAEIVAERSRSKCGSARGAVESRTFTSETDSEIFAHLIDQHVQAAPGDFPRAVARALEGVRGTWALCILHDDFPGQILAARNNAPLLIGLGDFVESAILSDGSDSLATDAGYLDAIGEDVPNAGVAYVNIGSLLTAFEPILAMMGPEWEEIAPYAPAFDRAVALNARSLVIVMVLPIACLLPLMFFSRRLPFAAHVVFALHFLAFLLLLFSVGLVVPAVDELFGGPGLASQAEDDAIGIVLVAICAVYLYLATRTVYGVEGIMRVFKTGVLVIVTAAIVLGYRFALLLLTLFFV